MYVAGLKSNQVAWRVVGTQTNFGRLVTNLARITALATGIVSLNGGAGVHAQSIANTNARVVATNIPGASAISQVGTFLNNSEVCSHRLDGTPILYPHPIPTSFPQFIQAGAVLDSNRILVGSRSNFGAPLAIGVGSEGSFLSIDPSRPSVLNVPQNFAQNGDQASTLGGAVQMYSANSPRWLNGVNNPRASTASFAGVSNPLGLSNNNAFGRLWPANAPFGDTGVGSSSILDPDGRPLKGAPSNVIGGVYVGSQTNRNVVEVPQTPQVMQGSLSTGAVGTALLGPSPDRESSHTCRAVFIVVTANGAIVQEHTEKGLDGLAPAGTVQPLLGRSWGPPNQDVEPRLGVLMNPYTATENAAWQLFITEPFNNTIAIINLNVVGTAPDQVFGMSSATRISSPFLKLPVDLAPVKRDADSAAWASNTTLDERSDFYVANRGDNTIVRMSQDGTVVAVRRIALDSPLNNASLNGIATSTDGMTIYVTVTSPSNIYGAVLALTAF